MCRNAKCDRHRERSDRRIRKEKSRTQQIDKTMDYVMKKARKKIGAK